MGKLKFHQTQTLGMEKEKTEYPDLTLGNKKLKLTKIK